MGVVSAELDRLVAAEAAALGPDLPEVAFIADIMRLLATRVAAAATAAAEVGGLGGGDGGGAVAAEVKRRLGTLIPLHCGHNASYSDGERAVLHRHVSRVMETWGGGSSVGAA